MSLKFLAKLSHFITMMFGIALGMTICMLYQYTTAIFIFDLSPLILLIVLFSGSLRVYTLFLWKKNNYADRVFND
jgi:hypothetical protein|tara:strand:+ start:1043 stop:1267 length:225 start_codon:yes stop_codon:yes gene_type:complete